MDCAALESVTFAQGSMLSEIAEGAFRATGLKSFVMPNTVDLLGRAPFERCTQLKSITLSETLTNVT